MNFHDQESRLISDKQSSERVLGSLISSFIDYSRFENVLHRPFRSAKPLANPVVWKFDVDILPSPRSYPILTQCVCVSFVRLCVAGRCQRRYLFHQAYIIKIIIGLAELNTSQRHLLIERFLERFK